MNHLEWIESFIDEDASQQQQETAKATPVEDVEEHSDTQDEETRLMRPLLIEV